MKIEDKMCLNFHYLRGVAIILIVGAHCLGLIKWTGSTLSSILSVIFDETSVIFMVITGFLSFRLEGKSSHTKFLIHKLKNVAMPYLITSSLAIVIYSFLWLNRRYGLIFMILRHGLWKFLSFLLERSWLPPGMCRL